MKPEDEAVAFDAAVVALNGSVRGVLVCMASALLLSASASVTVVAFMMDAVEVFGCLDWRGHKERSCAV